MRNCEKLWVTKAVRRGSEHEYNNGMNVILKRNQSNNSGELCVREAA